MIEWVYFPVSYTPVSDIHSLCISTPIAYPEGLNIFVVEISNDLQNTILQIP